MKKMNNEVLKNANVMGAEVTGNSINHPSHYNQFNYEVIDIIEDYGLDFKQGNVLKYFLRYQYKNKPLEDLLKAKWYLERLIKEEERKVENAKEAAGRLGDYLNAISRRVQ